MSSARITNRRVMQALKAVLDDDMATVASEEATAVEVAEIDRLIEDVERELAETERTVLARLTHDFTDQRRAFRASRRAGRGVLRSLPRVVPVEGLLRAADAGEVA